MKIKITLTLFLLVVGYCTEQANYPVRCVEVGDSPLGTVVDCDVSNDPLPFKWTATVQLKTNVKWAGIDDVKYFYSNPNETVHSNCTLGAPLPGTYKKGANITI